MRLDFSEEQFVNRLIREGLEIPISKLNKMKPILIMPIIKRSDYLSTLILYQVFISLYHSIYLMI